jgi:hypothetical protein
MGSKRLACRLCLWERIVGSRVSPSCEDVVLRAHYEVTHRIVFEARAAPREPLVSTRVVSRPAARGRGEQHAA